MEIVKLTIKHIVCRKVLGSSSNVNYIYKNLVTLYLALIPADKLAIWFVAITTVSGLNLLFYFQAGGFSYVLWLGTLFYLQDMEQIVCHIFRSKHLVT